MKIKTNKVNMFIGIFVCIVFVAFCAFSLGAHTQESNKTAETATSEESVLKQEEIKYPIKTENKYIGLYLDDLNVYEIQLKDAVNCVAWFQKLDEPSSATYKMSQGLDEHLYTPFITLEPGSYSLYDIANGTYDDVLKEYFSLFTGERSNTDVFIRFAHEMEMRPSYGQAWYSWQSYDYDTYVKAWKHVVDLGRQIAPNIKWVWSPNRADEYSYPYYPGDDYVDFVSLSLNNTSYQYTSFEQFYTSVGTKEFLERYNKPIIIGECAEHSYDPYVKSEYLKSILSYLENDDRIVGIVYLDKNIDGQRMYKFTDNQEQLDDFVSKGKEILSKNK